MASTQSKDSKLHGCEEADGQFTLETRDLLSSIPKQKAWVRSDHIYQYQNFWYGAAELQGVINMQRNFQSLDTDLIVATYPKCGTTWLKALSFAIINRYHFNTATFKQNYPLLTNNPHLLQPFWIITKNLENISLEEFYKQFCDGVVEYGSFWDHVLGYWKTSLQFPERAFFLKYEELKKEPSLHVIKLAQFLGYPFSAEEENEGMVEELLKLCSFDHLITLEANKNGKVPVLKIGCSAFFRRGEVGDHVNYLTPAMIERLDKITEEKFLGYGLKLG
ncbi:hypothetical protein MKW92_009854 [Papaver armeniacum]|nr:hypothetical protein MKW92_009854 [Papaver armeniacum]